MGNKREQPHFFTLLVTRPSLTLLSGVDFSVTLFDNPKRVSPLQEKEHITFILKE